MMTEQDALPGLEELAPPPAGDDLSADRRRTLRRAAMIDAGTHPLTRLPLLVGTGETCGDCAHHYRSGRWHKCSLTAATRGPGTDLRVGWPACQRYERGDR